MYKSGDLLENPQDGAEDNPDISDVIDNLGFGFAQLSQIAISGGMWMMDGCVVMLLASILSSMALEIEMTPYKQAALVSTVFCGVLIGNSMSGLFGDHHGRKCPIVSSLLGLAVCTSMLLFTTNYWYMAVDLFLVGFWIGVGQPSQVALVAEISPSCKRELAVAWSMFAFGIGEVYSAVLIWVQDPKMKSLDWRALVISISLPCVIFSLACVAWLHESPRILALQGRDDDAMSVLTVIRERNGLKDVALKFRPMGHKPRAADMGATWFDNIKTIFGKKLICITLACCFTCFTVNLLAYGTFYAFPLLLPHMPLHYDPAVTLISTVIMDIFGFLIVIVLGPTCPRRLLIVTFTLGQIFSLVAFLWATKQLWIGPSSTSISGSGASRVDLSTDVTMQRVLWCSMNGVKLFTTAVFALVYVYYSEIYPTKLRTTGFGIVLTVGKLGAIVAPVLFEYVRAHASTDAFFYITMVATVVNMAMFACMKETQGVKGDDTISDGTDSERMPLSERYRKPAEASC